MNKKVAAQNLNYFGAERESADRAGMDWMPSGASRAAIREACALKPARLTKAGRSLYESEMNPAVAADHLERKA